MPTLAAMLVWDCAEEEKMCNVHLLPPDILAGWSRQDIFLTVIVPLAIIIGLLYDAINRSRKINGMAERRGVLRLSIASLVCLVLAYIAIFDLAGPWADTIVAWQIKPYPEVPYSCSYDAIEAAADQVRAYVNLLWYLGFVLLFAGGILGARAQVKYNAARSERAMLDGEVVRDEA